MQFAGKGDKTEKYNLWKQRMEIYSGVTGKKDADLVPYILQGLDDEGLKMYNTFILTDEEKKQPKKIYEKFEERLNILKPNFRTARLDLHFFYQEADETLDDFYTRCKAKTKDCNFTNNEEKERFIEQLLASTPMDDFRKWLLDQDATITIDEVLKEGRKQETKLHSIKHLQERTSGTSVNAIKTQKAQKQWKTKASESKCKKCGRDHKRSPDSCPARESQCNYCDKIGHWEECCFKKNSDTKSRASRGKRSETHRRRGRGRGRKVDNIDEFEDDEDEFKDFQTIEYGIINIQVSDINAGRKSRNEAFGKIQIKVPDENTKVKKYLRMKVDTGAQGNTIPLRVFKKMMPEKINAQGYPDVSSVEDVGKTRLTAYNGSTIKCYGSITLQCRQDDDEWTPAKFYIVDVEGPAICGFSLSQQTGLVTMHCAIDEKDQLGTSESSPKGTTNKVVSIDDLIKKFPQQFDRIGNLPGKVKLHLKEDAAPFIDPPRKYSIHLKPQLHAELDKMEQQGVIAKVTEHSDWCSSLATSIKKDGSLRICLDPKKLNNSLKRCPHKAQTIEEISHKFHEAKYFSKLDAKAGYWGCQLDEDSQKLTTFRTPFIFNCTFM